MTTTVRGLVRGEVEEGRTILQVVSTYDFVAKTCLWHITSEGEMIPSMAELLPSQATLGAMMQWLLPVFSVLSCMFGIL